jgi:hypothetical protein
MQAAANAPFFILGCVRSGTTMLRDILRRHPNLVCPEETHFYRWHEPFGSPGFRHTAVSNPVLKRHREIDGVSETDFAEMLTAANSRADLCQRYMARFIANNQFSGQRWFDKTPQNAYGAAMIASEFPRASFIHIIRDPVNVVASLRIGKVMKMTDLVGACNYWNEAVANLAVIRRAYPSRVLEISYEAFTNDFPAGIQKVLAFLGEAYDPAHYKDVLTNEVRHDADNVLSPEELKQVRMLCLKGRIRHGYAEVSSKRGERTAQRHESRQKGRELRAGRRGQVAEKPPLG